MRRCLISLALLVSANAMAGCPALLDHTLRTLDERSQSLCGYAGNVLLGFCVNEYAIDFPMFAKSALGEKPFYAGLVKAAGVAPAWNFHKYLVDRTGRQVESFATRVEPNDPRLVATLERLLANHPEDPR